MGFASEVKFYVNPSHPPPEMGMTETATNFISFYDLLDYAICKGLEPLKLRGPFYRFGKLLLWDISNINWLETVVHELGHGQRAREDGIGAAYYIPYNYLPLAPWLGLKGAQTFRVLEFIPSDSNNSGEREGDRVVVGGMEAENVAARILRKRFYGTMPVRDMNFLWSIFCEPGTVSYILKGETGDVYSWLSDMVTLKTGDSIPSLEEMEKLYKNVRREAVIFSLVNPPFWQSLYYSMTLPFSDSIQTKVSMLRVGGIQFMPALSYGLTSSGTERYFEVYWRRGSFYGRGYFGHLWRITEPDAICAGFHIANIPFHNFRLSFDLHGWTGKRWGGALETEAGIGVPKSTLLIGAGAKSAGYLQGLPYNKAVWFRLGLKLRLGE